MKVVKRFKCEYCNKLTAREATMKKHEAECVHNPNSINCFRCAFACIDDYENDGYSTINDAPMCAYCEEMITHNDAPNCHKFKRSEKLSYCRDFEEASTALKLFEQEGE